LRAADMVDVRMRDDDRLHAQPVPPHDLEHRLDVVPRIHDQPFARLFVPEHRAIALQHPHRKDLVDHTAIVYSRYA
jgi:hypothetical protein